MPESIRGVLKAAVLRAMKARSRQELAVYRSALAAIDNAEAVPIGPEDRAGAVEASAVGIGSADVARRALTERDMVDVVRHEIEERRAAASSLANLNPAAAEQLEAEADVLLALLPSNSAE